MNIEIIHNILSEKTLTLVNKNLEYIRKGTSSFFNSKDVWHKEIIEFSKEVFIHILPKTSKEFDSINKDLLKLNLNRPPKVIMYYFWQPGSYIPWHTDKIYSNTLTIYINKEWDYSWGGLFQYYTNKEIKTIIPGYNIGLLQSGDLKHSTTVTTSTSPVRISIQIFFDDKVIKRQLV